MQELIPYLIKLSISLSVVYLFYQLVLRRLTFYNWNRWYLLFYSMAAFIIPFININPFLERNNWQTSKVVEIIPSVGYQVKKTELVNESVSLSVYEWVGIVIALGIMMMLCRLIIQHWSFRSILRKSTLLIDEEVKVYQVNKEIIPFSFGNSIFLNQHQHSEEELKEIIRHEFVHVKQKHTVDILWGEFLCILNWYNPFVWLIRKSIRQNLEFIADNKVIENGLDKKQYQYMLLKVVGVSQYSIATQFNFSSLKKRIAMMNKIKSAKFHLVKFLFIVPLLAVVLLAFRNQLQEQDTVRSPSLPNGSIDPAIEKYSGTDTTPGNFRLPKEIKSISVKNDLVTVKLKDGKVEKYDLSKPEEEAAFDKKYGKILPPPPPPPPPPGAPRSVEGSPMPPMAPLSVEGQPVLSSLEPIVVQGYPIAPTAPAPVTVQGHPIAPLPPLPPAPPEKNSKGNYISIVDADGDCIVIIRNKDKKIIKTLPLEEWNAKEKEFVSKYGEIPPANNKHAEEHPEEKLKGQGDFGVIKAPNQELYVFNGKVSTHVKASVTKQPTTIVNPTQLDPNVLYVLDGVKLTNAQQTLSNLNPDQIETINVLKGSSAEALYGAEGKNGVIVITTKAKKALDFSPESVTMRSTGGVSLEKAADFKGLIVLNGTEYTGKQFAELDIPSEKIESINVLKGKAATDKYGSKGNEGVVEVVLKKTPQESSSRYTRPDRINLSGIVIDKESRLPLFDARVYSPDLGIDTRTDSRGYFSATTTSSNNIDNAGVYISHDQYLKSLVFAPLESIRAKNLGSMVTLVGLLKGDQDKYQVNTTSSINRLLSITGVEFVPNYNTVKDMMKARLESYDKELKDMVSLSR